MRKRVRALKAVVTPTRTYLPGEVLDPEDFPGELGNLDPLIAVGSVVVEEDPEVAA